MNRSEREHGAAIVEFALVVTLLLTLMIGIFEGGRLFLLQASLASAARDAAREMAITGNEAAARASADAIFTPGYVWDYGASQVCPTIPTPGQNARVVLRHEATLMTGVGENLTFNLRGQGVMRCNG